jgi:hypothetical protein
VVIINNNNNIEIGVIKIFKFKFINTKQST